MNYRNYRPSDLSANLATAYSPCIQLISGGSLIFKNMDKPKLIAEKVYKNKWGWFNLYECPYCKKEFTSYRKDINSRKVKSCGCLKVRLIIKRSTTHNMANSKIYSTWALMKARVKKDSKDRKWYYDRGITMCNEWQKFEPFYEWAMKNGYLEDLEIDRRDNDKGYYPDNCRFITHQENSQNRRGCMNVKTVREIKIKLKNGESCKNISADLGISESSISSIKTNRIWQNIKI